MTSPSAESTLSAAGSHQSAARRKRPDSADFFAFALALLFFLAGLYGMSGKSPTFDESPHIAAGLSYVQEHAMRPNNQHPPLMKELAGIALTLSHVRLMENAGAWDMIHFEEVSRGERQPFESSVGSALIVHNGIQKVMFRARLPILSVCTLFTLVLYFWVKRMFGAAAALGAMFLCVFDPIMTAHAYFVTTDMGLSAFTTLFFFCLWRDLQKPGAMRLVVAGLTMGLMLCAKFSAVFMLPVAGLLMVLSPTRGIAGAPPGPEVLKRVGRSILAFGVMCLCAYAVIAVLYQSPKGLSMYWAGMNNIYTDNNPDFPSFFDGELGPKTAVYFPVAWLLKETIPAVVLALAGFVLLIRSRAVTFLDKLFVILPPVVFMCACIYGASEIGVRYLMPALPFTCIAGGVALAALFSKPAIPVRVIAVALSVWVVVALAGVYPDQLSYFNESACLTKDASRLSLAGGTACGPYWLDDSNVDWGQGMWQLRDWLIHHPDKRPLHLGYFGMIPPVAYGVNGVPLGVGEFDTTPERGLYITSGEYLARIPSSWLPAMRPSAIVAHTFYVFDIR